MNAQYLAVLLPVAAVSGVGVLIMSATTPLLRPSRPPAGGRAVTAEPAQDSGASKPWAALAPFRRNRQLPARRFDAVAMAAQTIANEAPRAPRPQLILRGIVFGATPIALIEGLPGLEGARGLRQGERLGDLLIRSVDRKEVRVTSGDTAWTLVIREPGR